MRLVFGFLLGVIAVIVAAVAYLYSGLYDIAATKPHGPVARWALNTAMASAVTSGAQNVEVPTDLGEARAEQGLQHFRETCVMCHGAPGVEPSEVGQGLTPDPPDLAHAAEEWQPAELFWIVKHGIKMTGMPAFGPTHEDGELWDVVAFVEQLPQMTAADYRARVEGASAGDAGSGEQPPQQTPAQ